MCEIDDHHGDDEGAVCEGCLGIVTIGMFIIVFVIMWTRRNG